MYIYVYACVCVHIYTYTCCHTLFADSRHVFETNTDEFEIRAIKFGKQKERERLAAEESHVGRGAGEGVEWAQVDYRES